MATINDRVINLCDHLIKDLKENTTSSFSTGDNSVWRDNLPVGVTEKQSNELYAYDSDFVAAGQMAIGKLGIAAMTADKKLEVVSGRIDMGEGRETSTVFHRSREYNAGPGSEEKVIKYGVPVTKYAINAGGDGQLNAVKNFLNEASKAALKI